MDDGKYYDFEWKQTGGKDHPYIPDKIKIVLNIIPHDVRTVVDVGCGDGTITNVLAERYTVMGVDISREGLKHLSVKASSVVSSADHLPLGDESADMVFSSELLEHFPDKVFLKAVSEIKRVSKKYILVTVPNEEKLRKRYTRCNTCGFEFHIYRHLRSFNLTALARCFDGYTVGYSTLCGALEGKSFDLIYHLRNKLTNSYFSLKTVSVLCPNCGNALSFPFKRNFPQKMVAFSLAGLQYVLNYLLNREPEPDWLVALFAKESPE